MSGQRNRDALSERDIEICIQVWELLGGPAVCPLTTTACETGSRTAFVQRGESSYVRLGADVLPNRNLLSVPDSRLSPRARLSLMACLAHELAHAERYFRHGFDRSVEHPDALIDEAETSIHASFNIFLDPKDRRDLIEDASDQLAQWLDATRNLAERN
jgi:hypothetical protein